MAAFYTYEQDMETEKSVFLRNLYHDKKGGQMIRLRKKGTQVDQLSTCDMDELAATGTDFVDTYTTINTFRGYKRTSDKVFNFCSLYIDLDCHSDNLDQVQAAKMRAVEILEAAFSDGLLAAPTMITDTGRGFGLQYILAKSVANTWRTEKIKALYKKVRKKMYEKYQEILSTDPQAAQPDAAVLDDARVCRIPGTYNTLADRYCRLIGVSGKFYELSDLVQECHLWNWKSDEEYKKAKGEKARKKKEIASRSVVSFAEYKMPFLSTRLEQLEKLQEMRGEGCTDSCREQMLFIAYSALKQLDPAKAALRLQEMNKKFTTPLPQAELEHIIQETDQSVGTDHKGYYKLSNAYVVEMLAITDAEAKELGIGQGLKRAADRKAAKDKKRETRNKIVELLTQPDLTYEQIAEAAGVSRRTVCTIAKAEGLMRYSKAAQRQNHPEEKTEIIPIESVREGAGPAGESANSATGSVCVSFSVLPGTCLSTPSVRGSGGEDLAWEEWLYDASSTSPIAAELLDMYRWSHTRFTGSSFFHRDLTLFLDHKMPYYMRHPEKLAGIRTLVARKFFEAYGLDECTYLFGAYTVADVLPTVWELFVAAVHREERKKQSLEQKRNAKKQRKHTVVDVETETDEQREARIDRYLKKYKDERFDIIENTDEYKKRLDPDVIRVVKTVCMQVGRLKREFFWIEKQKVQTADIKQCFDSLTYKDIVIICERMAHQGTIQDAKKPFYYVLQVAWKYRHPDAAEAQANRIKEDKDKPANRFNNFESRTYDFDFGKFIEINAMRKITGQPLLSKDEYMDMFESC